jgi:glycolate oxidase iron-sulfur subunit
VQHRIPVSELGPHGEGMARAITACVHCGFCLSACPTYKVLGEEMDSPRGRIMLMKQHLEGELRTEDVQPYVDRCLGCLACETACPSGVIYRDLLVPFRARIEPTVRPWHSRLSRIFMLSILETPARFRAAHRLARIGKSVSQMLPAQMRNMLSLLPDTLPSENPLPPHTPAAGVRRARIALLAGCVQRALRPSINHATIRVLAANGVEVLVPPGQGCCGALAQHSGLEGRGGQLAAKTRAHFPSDVDAIITNAAGCGSAMKEQAYPARVADVCEFLDAVGLTTALALPQPTTAAYHDACHLAHGQGIRAAPRRLLQGIANLTVIDLADNETCCGSAGLYNLEHPLTAATLGRAKAAAIAATGASLVATGNIGCITQIEAHSRLPVMHTIELLDSAYSFARRDS